MHNKSLTTALKDLSKEVGLAYSYAVPQPGMAKSYYETDCRRYEAAWHVAHCVLEDCDDCQGLCDSGLVISCDDCGHVHHTDWLGWYGEVDEDGHVTVWCPECKAKNEKNG